MFLAGAVGCGVASAQTSYGPGLGASVTTASDNSCSNLSTPCKADVYPSTITVPGGASTVTADVSHPFSVTISGISAPYNSGNCSGTTSIAFLLKGPGGQFLEIMSAAGGVQQAVANGSIAIASNGAAMPFYPANWPGGATATFTGNLGSYTPGSFWNAVMGSSGNQDAYPSPGPGTLSASSMATSNGSGTYNSVFNGKQANGTWGLYMISDDYPSCTASFTGWTLSFSSTGTSNDTTSTTISNATANPITAAASVTFTASVANTSTSATPTGAVTFTSTPYAGGSTTTLCSAVALSGSGATVTATCATTALATEGIADINATYNPGSGFTGSSTTSPYYEWVNNPTTSGGTDVFCNAGTITGTSEINMSPFPSVVTVSGISNAVQDVTVELKNYSFADEGRDALLLLKAPNGSSMVLMSDLGGGVGTTTNTGSVTFSDSGAPATGANPLAGNGALTYAPTALYATPAAFLQTLPATPPSGEPTVPATAASGTYAGIGVPATVGTATLFSTFDGITANGTWSLFAYTDNQPLSIGGWCLGITPATGVATTTVASGSPNPDTTGAAVAITATVSSGSATPTGTVAFKDGLTNTTISGCGSVALSAGGTNSATATCNVSTLVECDHTITATYSGVTNTFNQSIGSYDQRINTAITTSLAGGVLTYCNTGAIQIPGPNSVGGGAAYPNPSNITVAGLFGTVNTVSVALKNFKELRPDFLTSLLVGPGGNLDFFSGAGGDSSPSTFASLLFADSAGGQVPGTLGAGPYKPTSDPASGSFPPLVFTSSPFYAVPGTIHSAATNGSSTFASSFGGTAPNGNWDLFFYDHTDTLASAGNGLSRGWCLNIAPHVPTFTITETHSPDNFIQGNTGQITLNVNNSTSAPAVTSGGSAYPVTITDALPNGLTYASISGAANDWSCSGTTTVTCTNVDVVAGGSAYGTLVLNLNISGTATGGNNPTQVSEGAPGTFGTATGLSSADNIPVIPAPVLSVSEGYSGTFTQGVTGGMLTVTVSNTAGATSSTGGTTTVTETLPTGYVASSFTGAGWSCSGNNSITCSSTQAVAGGASFNVIDITLEVPTTAVNPTVTNAATASGGGASASATSGTVSFPVVQVPTTMTAGSGTSPQSTAINTAFATSLSVTLTDAARNPVSSTSVTFTAPGSGASGTFSNSTNTITVTTNASGVASAPFTATATLGGPYTVTASSGSLTAVNFSLSNTAGAPSSMTANAGATPQSAAINTAFATALSVTVKDAGNNPVSGVSVTFTAPSSGVSGLFGNSSITSTATTNASGVASAPFTANATAGGYMVAAAAAGLTTVNFSLTNTAGAPSSMTANVGATPQSAAINTAFVTALSVTVKDAGNNPVSGVNVTFTAPSSGASGLFGNSSITTTVATNASGVASAPFTANATLGGPYTVTATSGSLTAVNFSLSNTVGAATHFSVSAPSAATSKASFSFTVTALDVSGNAATGYGGTVHFTSSDGAATSLPSNSTLTAGTGTFSATLKTVGNQTITATDTVSSSVTGTSGQINVAPSYTQITAFSIFADGPVYNRGTRLFYETVTITNTGGATINGPIQLAFNGLTSGLTLANSVGTAPNGSPYLTIASSLGPGASASVMAQFSNPSNILIPISITAYSGVF